MKTETQYKILVAIGFIIWIIGTWYGGWQREAQSGFERMTDTIGLILVFWGVFGDIANNLTINKITKIKTKKTIVEVKSNK